MNNTCEFKELKPFLGKVINCKIVDIDNSEFWAVFYIKDKKISVRCTMSRIPLKVQVKLNVGVVLPIYMAKLDFDHIEGNLYSTQIPEQLLKKRMNYMANLYLKCVKRICGEFSRIITSRQIDRSAIKEIEALLGEKINVTIIAYSQLRDIERRKLSPKGLGKRKRATLKRPSKTIAFLQ